MNSKAIAAALMLLLVAGSASAQTSMVPPYSHIVVVVEENHGYNEIIGNSAASYINHLATVGALLANNHAIAHPSEPNYFAMYAGSTFGVTDDGQYSEPDPTLYNVLDHAGLSFRAYIEPGNTDFDHEPWESFREGASVERGFFKDFPQNDFAKLPSVAFVIPNLDHDMHDGSIEQGDVWLQKYLGAYAEWAPSNNSLLIVTFDENEGAPGNHIATVLVGAKIAPGTVQTAYSDHYNLLSTILAAFNLTGPRHAATADHYAVFQP